MNVNQLPILGAEIRGLDLSLDLTDSENKDIKDLLTENLVLIITVSYTHLTLPTTPYV